MSFRRKHRSSLGYLVPSYPSDGKTDKEEASQDADKDGIPDARDSDAPPLASSVSEFKNGVAYTLMQGLVCTANFEERDFTECRFNVYGWLAGSVVDGKRLPPWDAIIMALKLRLVDIDTLGDVIRLPAAAIVALVQGKPSPYSLLGLSLEQQAHFTGAVVNLMHSVTEGEVHTQHERLKAQVNGSGSFGTVAVALVVLLLIGAASGSK